MTDSATRKSCIPVVINRNATSSGIKRFPSSAESRMYNYNVWDLMFISSRVKMEELCRATLPELSRAAEKHANDAIKD